MTEIRKAKDFKDAQANVSIIVSNRQLSSWYDKYAKQVLLGTYTTYSDSGNYQITQQLPTKEEYPELKRKKFTHSWDSHLSDIISWVEDVSEQMENWRDTTPEPLQSTDKFSSIEECCDQLNDAKSELDDATSALSEVNFSDTFAFYPHVGDITKNTTLGDAVGCLEQLIDSIENYELHQEDDENESEGWDNSEIIQSLNNALDNLQSIEIPGVYSS